MKISVRLANRIYGIIFNTFFRPSYSVKRLRWGMEFLAGVSAEKLEKRYPTVKWEKGRLGEIEIETVIPSGPLQCHILYAHGGGYFMGSIHSYRRNVLRIAYRCRAKVTTFNYRLAPEHPFPAALEDAKLVYRELYQREKSLPLVLAGDSAGGGLTLATVLALRAEKLPLPQGIFVISPYLDLTVSLPSVKYNATKDRWLSERHVEAWAPWYARSFDRKDPLVSPVFADYHGLPPLLVLVGDQEVLLDEAKVIVQKANAAGSPATLFVGRDMQHAWCFALPMLEESKKAINEIARFVSGILSKSGCGM